MMKRFLIVFLVCSSLTNQAQHSVARQWNDLLLEAIRGDFARPTVHARNLFHTSIAMYDSWAVFDGIAETYFLGKEINGFSCEFVGISDPADPKEAAIESISYACYRILTHRFRNSPGVMDSQFRFDSLMDVLGYDKSFTSTNYQNDGPPALGNYIASCIIDFGLQDGSNEINDYANEFYVPTNPNLAPDLPGNPFIFDPNRWQPLTFETFIDQSGNPIPGNAPPFLSPEWGKVVPFALSSEDLTIYEREGFDYWVYLDPGPPPFISNTDEFDTNGDYNWGFSMVSIWSSHLDPSDSVMWDISPASLGDPSDLPDNASDYPNFYNFLSGGITQSGYDENPVTGEPYDPQIVPRADYARVLAEFWADGPDSETPPGHWFILLNYVNDHPELEKRWQGTGEILDDLEWDVKTYFALSGAVHDAAVAAWGLKGWYDYIRPISALRFMCDQGQSSAPELPNYSPTGIKLLDGYIELVDVDDPLAGVDGENIGKIKLYAWKGPDFISDPESDVAGVGWILAENWWPYQRPTFVTPPFAGFVSGHSTFSRAAAEVLTLATGSEYFPGGVGEFIAKKNEFLVFEDGPSVDVILQWAKYRDASDQSAISRIWGGIHPPADDIPGRKIGIKVGIDAFNKATQYFEGNRITGLDQSLAAEEINIEVYPNPVYNGSLINISGIKNISSYAISDLSGKLIKDQTLSPFDKGISTIDLNDGIYLLSIQTNDHSVTKRIIIR